MSTKNESPYHQLNRLNNLFSHYQDSNYSSETVIKKGQQIQQFSIFQVPEIFKKMNQSGEQERPRSLEQKNYSKQQDFWDKHQIFVEKTKSQLSLDRKPLTLTRPLYKQIRLRKPFQPEQSIQFQSTGYLQNAFPTVRIEGIQKIGTNFRQILRAKHKKNKQSLQIDSSQITIERATSLHQNPVFKDFAVKLQNKMINYKSVHQSPQKILKLNIRLGEVCQKYLQTVHTDHIIFSNFQTYNISDQAQAKVDCFKLLIANQLNEMDKFYENQVKFQ